MNPPKQFSKVLSQSLKDQKDFPVFGFFDLSLMNQDQESQDSYSFFYKKYKNWIQSNQNGEMKYLEGDRMELRSDPKLLFPSAQSVLCLAFPYPVKFQKTNNQPQYARYLQGSDYHTETKKKSEQFLESLKFEGLEWKICVDTSPVFERAWGYLCGLGWVGKNTMLIHPQIGSYFFIVTVFLNQKTNTLPAPMKDYCGNCTRCLGGCPTSAFVSDRILDAKKCISYLNLEYRGEIDTHTSKKMGTWQAGCDVCQEVCPFNLKREKKELDTLSDKNYKNIYNKNFLELILETEIEYKNRVKGSALERVKPKMSKRNLAISLRNSDFIKDYCKFDLKNLMNRIEIYMEQENDPYLLKEWSLTHYTLKQYYCNNS